MTLSSTSNASSSESTSIDTRYHDLTTTFAGYINKAKIVNSATGAFWSVSLCILSGKKDNPTKSYIETTVCGKDAIALITKYEDQINADIHTSIFGRFVVSNITAICFAKKDGSIVPGLKGQLFAISYLKVGDNVVKSTIKNLKD